MHLEISSNYLYEIQVVRIEYYLKYTYKIILYNKYKIILRFDPESRYKMYEFYTISNIFVRFEILKLLININYK